MPTNDERRRVAEKLREYASWDDEGCLVDCQEWGESVLNLLDCGDTEGECYEALADLIEPPTQCPHYHSDRHYCSVHEDMQAIDRDALLALAEELEEGDVTYLVSTQYVLDDYARRIREACGKTQDD